MQRNGSKRGRIIMRRSLVTVIGIAVLMLGTAVPASAMVDSTTTETTRPSARFVFCNEAVAVWGTQTLTKTVKELPSGNRLETLEIVWEANGEGYPSGIQYDITYWSKRHSLYTPDFHKSKVWNYTEHFELRSDEYGVETYIVNANRVILYDENTGDVTSPVNFRHNAGSCPQAYGS
jgi:hypothetical protein